MGECVLKLDRFVPLKPPPPQPLAALRGERLGTWGGYLNRVTLKVDIFSSFQSSCVWPLHSEDVLGKEHRVIARGMFIQFANQHIRHLRRRAER